MRGGNECELITPTRGLRIVRHLLESALEIPAIVRQEAGQRTFEGAAGINPYIRIRAANAGIAADVIQMPMAVDGGLDRPMSLLREIQNLLSVLSVAARVHHDQAVGCREDDRVAIGLLAIGEGPQDDIHARSDRHGRVGGCTCRGARESDDAKSSPELCRFQAMFSLRRVTAPA